MTKWTGLVFFMLSPSTLDHVPKDQVFPITALIEQAIALGEQIGAFRISGGWLDVGRHDELRQAQHSL